MTPQPFYKPPWTKAFVSDMGGNKQLATVYHHKCKLTIIINPRRHRGGGQSDPPPLDFFGLKFFVPWPITKSFGTTVLCLLTHLLTLIKWRHDWWHHHNKSCNLCVDYENAIFCYKSSYYRLNTDNFTVNLTILEIPIAKCCFHTIFSV